MSAPAEAGVPVRVAVVPETCVGHGRCYSLAPEVYAPDDEGFVTLLHDRPLAPGSVLAGQARLGVQSCPERALVLQQD